MMIKSKLIITLLFVSVSHFMLAQDILKELKAEKKDTSFATIATFKGAYISFGHSVETRNKGALEISWMNRFWNRPIPDSERVQTFVADKWNSRIGADYSISDRLTVGIGYATGYRSVDAYGKYRLFYQRDHENGFPLSITLLQKGVFRGLSSLEGLVENIPARNKLASITQLLLARKITRNFSLQVAPSFIFRGEEGLLEDEVSGRFAIGIGARYKVGNHVSVVSEYYAVPNRVEFIDTFGAFSLGANWEVSDLLLQFKLTNVRNFVEDKSIIKTENNFNFRDGNFHFGFQATYFIQL